VNAGPWGLALPEDIAALKFQAINVIRYILFTVLYILRSTTSRPHHLSAESTHHEHGIESVQPVISDGTPPC
jgi:hypothetical protein